MGVTGERYPHNATDGGEEDARASDETSDETSVVVALARSRATVTRRRRRRIRSTPGTRTIGKMTKKSAMMALVVASCVVVGARASEEIGTCVNKEHYAPFARAGAKPSKGKGLTFCDAHRRSTCCGKEQTDAVRTRVVHMQLNGFSETCRDAWAGVECGVCDARVGTSEGVPVCGTACDALYRACKDDFFAEDASQRLVPCRPQDTICTKLSEWIGDARGKGAEMCRAAGWDPVTAGERWCFDGSTAAMGAARSSDRSYSRSGSSSTSKKSSKSKGSKKKKKSRDASPLSSSSRAAIFVGGAAGILYVVFSRLVPLALRYVHRKGSMNARYAARRAAESRSRAHYL